MPSRANSWLLRCRTAWIVRIIIGMLFTLLSVAAYSADSTLPKVIDDLAVSPDGRTFAVATEVRGGPYAVYLLSPDDGQAVSTIRGKEKLATGASSVAFTPDSKTLLIADGGIRRLALPSLAPIPPPTDPTDRLLDVSSVAVSTDGKYMTACLSYRFMAWDLATEKVIYDNGPDNPSHETGHLPCTVSPDGQLIMVFDSFHHYVCWQTKPSCSSIPGEIDSFVFRPDGKGAAWLKYAPVDSPNKLVIGTVDTRRIVRSMAARAPAGSEDYRHLAYSPDSKLLALGGEGIAILEPEKGQIQKLFYSAEFPIVDFLQFTPDGKRIVFAMKSAKDWYDSQIGLCDLAAKKLVWTVALPALPKN